MKESLARHSPEKKHGRADGPSIEGLSSEAVESAADRMKRFQSMERTSGRMDDFGEDIGIEVAMGKDMSKRPGAERGEDMFLADKETGLTGVFDGLGGEGPKGSGADAASISALFAPSLYRVIKQGTEKHGDLKAELSEVAAGQASFEHPNEVAAKKSAIETAWGKAPASVQKEIINLYKTIQKLSEKAGETQGMTTATVGKTVYLPDGRAFEIIASVGDSGAMHIDAEGRAKDATSEDSAVDDVIAAGMLTRKQSEDPNFMVTLPNKAQMSVANLRRGMSQALGMPGRTPIPRISITELKAGESMVYATDGIRDEIADAAGSFDTKRAAGILAKGGVEALMNEAAKGKKKDERTIIKKERFLAAEPEEEIEELSADDITIVEDANGQP